MKNILIPCILFFMVIAVYAQNTQPATEKPEFKTPLTENGLSINIESTRIIGNMIMVSGKMSSVKEQAFDDIGVVATTQEGESIRPAKIFFGGKPVNLAFGLRPSFMPELPVAFDLLIPVKGQKLSVLTTIKFNMTQRIRYSITFKDVKIPMENNPELNPGGTEIYKNVFLVWKKTDEAGGHLKLHFVIDNKSGREVAVNFRGTERKIVDANGGQFNKCTLFLNKQEDPAAVNIEPDVPVAGYFDFQEKIPLSSVKMFQFESDIAKYSLREIKIVP